jgi:hypothetical protein
MQAANRSARRTRVTKTLWPPQAGTMKLSRQYGESLLCVRYRHDTSGLRRFTTVELVIGEAAVLGKQAHCRLYGVQIPQTEEGLRQQAHRHGASWDPHTAQWVMNGAQVKALGLEDHARPLGKMMGNPPDKTPGRT